MWREFFGDGCEIYGIDIEDACRVYRRDGVEIHIGDQEDREFWRALWDEIPPVDIVIDDGGHKARQQIVTLEETLPHIRPGGVFVCEDIHGADQRFANYVGGLMTQMHAYNRDDTPELVTTPTPFQASVHSIQVYPYLTAIQMQHAAPAKLRAPKHGSEWQPFERMRDVPASERDAPDFAG